MVYINKFMRTKFLQRRYDAFLLNLIKAHPRAVDLGKTECIRCGFCCAIRPCIPTPDELSKIATFLKMEVQEMVKKYFIVEVFEEHGTNFIFPAKETQLDIVGTFGHWDRTFDLGYCCFFNKETHLCKIYPVRPQNAKSQNCWEKISDEDHEKITKKVLDSWEGVDLSMFGVEISRQTSNKDSLWIIKLFRKLFAR